jgi:hypothetical protein
LTALQGLAEDVLEYVLWRREWNRTANPVAFWISAGLFLSVLLVVAFWLTDLWPQS